MLQTLTQMQPYHLHTQQSQHSVNSELFSSSETVIHTRAALQLGGLQELKVNPELSQWGGIEASP